VIRAAASVVDVLDLATVWIVGASSGYGRAIAINLASRGWTVILSGRDIEKLHRLRDLMVASKSISPEKVKCLSLDMSCNVVPSALTSFSEICSSLDALIYCAAIPASHWSRSPLLEVPEERIQSMVSTNGLGAIRATRISYPALKHSTAKSPKIILFSSMAGRSSLTGYGDYNISKALLDSISRNLADELTEIAEKKCEKKISVYSVIAGEAHSGMNSNSRLSPNIILPLIIKLLAEDEPSDTGASYLPNGTTLD
jgi:NAD(P)-dependent dehydrogenase (short-subunit alcohol dehydrogenase family)